MSVTTTAIFLFHGFNGERGSGPWPDMDKFNGFAGLLDHMEHMAGEVERLWEKEHAHQNYPGVYDYEITEALGAWLYHNPELDISDFNNEHRRLFDLGSQQ